MESTPTLVIITTTKVESQAVLDTFLPDKSQRPISHTIEGRTYFDLGMVQDARVYMIQSEMGSGGLGASAQAVAKAIDTLSPRAVIMVGIAFGMNQEKQAIGDVLVSQQLRLYDLQRVGTRKGRAEIVLRGDKPPASPSLLNLFKGAELTWKGDAEIRFGPILTGEKLVDNQNLTKQLHGFEPEAIGGEMEGAGLYVACHDKKTDWILVKGICDWADGNKGVDKTARQQLAATNAAAFVYHALNFSTGSWDKHLPPSQSGTTSQTATIQTTEKSTSKQTLTKQTTFEGYTDEEICAFLKSVNEDSKEESRGFVELHRRHNASLRSYVMRYCHIGDAPAWDLDDIVSDVWFRFLRYCRNNKDQLESFNVKSLLLTIAKNSVSDLIRKHRRLDSLSFQDGAESTPSIWERAADECLQPENKLLESVLGDAVKVAMQKLTRTEREILVLHLFHNYSITEIATLMELSPAKVRLNRFRATQELRKILEEQGFLSLSETTSGER